MSKLFNIFVNVSQTELWTSFKNVLPILFFYNRQQWLFLHKRELIFWCDLNSASVSSQKKQEHPTPPTHTHTQHHWEVSQLFQVLHKRMEKRGGDGEDNLCKLFIKLLTAQMFLTMQGGWTWVLPSRVTKVWRIQWRCALNINLIY